MLKITETGKQIEAALGCHLWQLGLSINDMEELGMIEKSRGPVTAEELKALVAGARVELAYPPL